MHSASATQSHAAAKLGAAHAEFIAQNPEQRGFLCGIDRLALTVDIECRHLDFLVVGTGRSAPGWYAAYKFAACPDKHCHSGRQPLTRHRQQELREKYSQPPVIQAHKATQTIAIKKTMTIFQRHRLFISASSRASQATARARRNSHTPADHIRRCTPASYLAHSAARSPACPWPG